ncbi:unnamed protein product [Adineta steineri]|uniref:Uncharacterized protein n=1 Tax=Adineta steineri TaxID=433720 RepID=A0A815RG72_9BILA|nr:unnamed protein product [Adineta steineri]CAF4032900.1 unnamed protein product [Adineta steineri]
MRCVDSIFLYCDSNEYFQYNRPDHSKVVDLFKNVDNLVCRMERTVTELGQHLSIRRQYRKNKSNKHVLYEFGDFLWLNIFIEGARLFHRTTYITDNRSPIQDLVRLARIYYHGDPIMLKKVNKFSSSYCSDKALHWYTHSIFPYKLLNKTLRTEDFNLLITFMFFIIDIKECLAREYQDSKEKRRMTLYRGINISSGELEKLKQRKDNLISMNGFISTTRSKSVSEMFAGNTDDKDGKAAVIFEIECDTHILDDSLVLADIAEYSVMSFEQEVLIDIGAVFLIRNIKQDLGGTWIINITASTEIKSICKEYIKHYEFDPYVMENSNREMLRFSALCCDRGCYEKAQEHLERLLSKPNAEEIAQVYITMTRAENLEVDHEILIRDYYDYIRDRLSTEDSKQLARILNKIGFFLPPNKHIRNQENILKLLEIHKDSSYDSSEMENFSTVLPYFGDYYRDFVVSQDIGLGYPFSVDRHHDARLTFNRPDDLLILNDSDIRLQSHSTERDSAAKQEYLRLANIFSSILIDMKHGFNDKEE